MADRPIRVFFNASALPARPAGAGTYTLALGRALASHPAIELVVATPAPYDFGQGPGLVRVPGRMRQAWELTMLNGQLPRSGADVYHGAHFFTPSTSLPSVATVHDLTFFRLPARYGHPHRLYYRFLARSARRATRIIVPSGAVASDVVRFLDYPPERVRVIAEAPRTGLAPATDEAVAEARARYGLDAPYLLCLGTAEPGKRAVDAVRAMPAVRAAAPGTLLALAGAPGRVSEALQGEARRLGVSDAVLQLGYVADEDLAPLLTGATALVFPSLYEGFGLPPLEAMACGTPVIASRAPAMSEVLAGAAMFVEVGDAAGIAGQAICLLRDASLRADRSAAAIEFAARFSWAQAAAETVDVYRELVA